MELMNAIPLLTEIKHALAALKVCGESRTLNLSNFPLTNDDSQFLDEVLGRGHITISFQGLEHTFWQEAKISGVWWGEYRNANHQVMLRTLEITCFPELAKSQPEDIEDSIQKLEEMLSEQTPNVVRSLSELPVLSNGQ